MTNQTETLRTDFLTSNQLNFIEKLKFAARYRKIVILEVPHGTGLQYATCKVMDKLPSIKVIYIDCEQSNSSRKICIRLLKEAMNVSFSNLNYFSVTVEDLILVVKQRMKTDLSNKTVLLVFDHIDELSILNLKKLLKLLSINKLICGIVIRTTTQHRLKLDKMNSRLHDDLYLHLTKERLIGRANEKEEMRIFIRDVQGIKNESFTIDLLKTKNGFSRTLSFIKKFKEVGGE